MAEERIYKYKGEVGLTRPLTLAERQELALQLADTTRACPIGLGGLKYVVRPDKVAIYWRPTTKWAIAPSVREIVTHIIYPRLPLDSFERVSSIGINYFFSRMAQGFDSPVAISYANPKGAPSCPPSLHLWA